MCWGTRLKLEPQPLKVGPQVSVRSKFTADGAKAVVCVRKSGAAVCFAAAEHGLRLRCWHHASAKFCAGQLQAWPGYQVLGRHMLFADECRTWASRARG